MINEDRTLSSSQRYEFETSVLKICLDKKFSDDVVNNIKHQLTTFEKDVDTYMIHHRNFKDNILVAISNDGWADILYQIEETFILYTRYDYKNYTRYLIAIFKESV